MPQLKLNYFDFHGGRAGPVRLALHIGGIAFEDHRFTFPEFAEFRKTTPFGQVPTLEVDGLHLTQCDAMPSRASWRACTPPTRCITPAVRRSGLRGGRSQRAHRPHLPHDGRRTEGRPPGAGQRLHARVPGVAT